MLGDARRCSATLEYPGKYPGVLGDARRCLAMLGDARRCPGFLAHYGVHGELMPCAGVGEAGRAEGVGDSETLKSFTSDTGLTPAAFIFVDIYMLRSRHSTQKYHKIWLEETRRRYLLLNYMYDLAEVRSAAVETLKDLANAAPSPIKLLHSLGKPAQKAIQDADTAKFVVKSLSHPAAKLYGRRNFWLDRPFHDAAYTAIRTRDARA